MSIGIESLAAYRNQKSTREAEGGLVLATFISFGAIYSNAPNQNAGVFIGQNSFTGWDANQKFNIAHGASFGPGNIQIHSRNFIMDGFEYIDAMINDMDYKPSSSIQI